MGAQAGNRSLGDDRARRPETGQLSKIGFDGLEPIVLDRRRTRERGEQRIVAPGDRFRRRQHEAGDRAGKNRAADVEHHLRRRGRADRLEHVDLPLRAGHRFADVDRANQIVGKPRAGLVPSVFEFLLQEGLDFVGLAVNVRLRRRGFDRVRDHAADIGQGRLPIAEWYDLRHRDVGAAAEIFLIDGRHQIAAAAARAILQPPVDERHGEKLEIEPPRIFDRIDALLPRSNRRQGQRQRLVRLYDFLRDGGFRVGLSEIGLGGFRSLALPIAVIFPDQPDEFVGIAIADDDHNRPVRPIPAIVKRLHRTDACRGERFGGSDGRAIAKQLAGKQMRRGRIGNALLRPVILAQFGQDDPTLGIDRRRRNARFAHHPGKQLHAFVQVGGRHAG